MLTQAEMAIMMVQSQIGNEKPIPKYTHATAVIWPATASHRKRIEVLSRKPSWVKNVPGIRDVGPIALAMTLETVLDI